MKKTEDFIILVCCRMYAYGTGAKTIYFELSGWKASNNDYCK